MNFGKKSEIKLGGQSFTLIENMLADADGRPVGLEGFLLSSPDKSFSLEISYYASEPDAKSFLDHLPEEVLGFRLIDEIRPIRCGSLYGYRCHYEDKNSLNEEYVFDLTDHTEYNRMNISLSFKKESE